MDKKSILNDLHKAVVISSLAIGYSMLGKKILKMMPQSIQKLDLEDTGKLFAFIFVSKMTRVSYQTEDPTRTYQHLKWPVLRC